MPTQVPPSRLDSTKDFSSLVPSAFAKANAAFEAANTASGAAATSTPKISSIVYPGNDTAAATAGGQTVTLNGAGFNAGASVLINGSYAGVVSVANSTSLSFTTPSNSGGTYILYVINTDGGTGISVPGISYSGTPSWSNAAGSLATVYETAAVNTQLTATGDIADGTITYSLQSGTLPPGSSLNSSTGLLSGTTQVTENSTTYNFTIRATDGQNQDTDRAFSITISPDVVTWSSPADGTVTALSQNEAMSNVTLSATSAAGQSVSYTANALPTGVTISGSNVTGTPTVLGNTISVITATAANTNRTATRTFTWVVSVANDTFFKNTTLLLNGETTVTPFINDASTNNLALTIQGDTKPVLFNPYTPGYYSNYFDGTGDYLSVSTGTIAIGTGDLTLECWGYRTSTTTLQSLVNINAYNTGILIRWETTKVTIYVGGTDYSYNTPTDIPLNSWVHIALVRSGGVFKFYVNGTQATTFNSSYSLSVTSVTIGTSSHDTSDEFYGYISNVRLVNSAIYTTNFTPPTAPLTAIANTSLLTCQSNRLIDNSTNNFTITKAGDVSVSSAIPFTANSSYSTYGSTYFDGTGDYLSIGTTQLWTPSNNLTIEGWFNISTTGNRCIFSKDSGSSGSSRGLFIYITSTGAVSVFYSVSGSSEAFATSSTGLVVANQWYHLAVVKNGSSCAVYLNGVSIATFTAATIACPASPTNYIGIFNASYPMLGYISNLRIVNGTAVYTSAFTPPTQPLTAIANTSLLTLQYNGGATNQGIIDNSNFNNIVTRFGNTSQGTFSPYSVTGWSNYFSSNYLSFPNSSAFAFGTGAFTIEFWINAPSLLNDKFFISGRGAIGTMHITSGGFGGTTVGSLRYVGSSTITSSSTVVTDGLWHHCAIVRDGSNNITLYVDGVSRGTGTDSTNYTTTSGTWYVNANDSGPTAGGNAYYSNLRIVKGTALYTSAFTPSTTPLTAVANTSLLTCQSNRFIDNSPNTFTLTKAGDVSVQAFSPFGGVSEAVPISYSNFFDGTGDYLSTVLGAPLSLTSTDSFTIEFWLYMPALPSAIGYVFHTIYAGTATYCYISSTGVILFGSSSGGTRSQSNSALSINTWYHVAICRSGVTERMFINGVAQTQTSGQLTHSLGTLYFGTDSSQNYYTKFYLSNFRIVKLTGLYSSNFTVPTSPLTAITNTQLLICQSATMVDNSTNNFTITANGDTKPSTFNPFGYTAQTATSYTPSLHGGSAYFDGTGDYLQIANPASWGTTSDFTIEHWFYPTSLASIQTTIGVRNDINYNAGQWYWYISATNGTTYFYWTNGPGSAGAGSGSSKVQLNQWNHLAVCRKSGTITMYMNGVQDPGTSTSNTIDFSLAGVPISIGRAQTVDGLVATTGYITDVKITKGVALYSASFYPPVSPATPTTTLGAISYPSSLLLNFNNGGIIDQHSTNVLETVGNAQLSTAVKKYGSGSISMTSSGDYLKGTQPSVVYDINGGNFTIEFWVNFTSLAADRALVSKYSNAAENQGGIGYVVQWVQSSSVLRLVLGVGGGSDALYTWPWSPSTSTWYHVAITRSGTSGRAFVNGIQIGTTLTLSISDVASPNAIQIGKTHTVAQYLLGYIDDLRITKGYARYTSNFTPPSALITK